MYNSEGGSSIYSFTAGFGLFLRSIASIDGVYFCLIVATMEDLLKIFCLFFKYHRVTMTSHRATMEKIFCRFSSIFSVFSSGHAQVHCGYDVLERGVSYPFFEERN
ncbi:unnamed protein product [Trifolium pratense]|uniref:Uncharacterized protein n=1 Tax=Trifolium pratense TaxID=57577 RepID=A0ACB0JI63_TRIPR|nr:unnamed protein product [Trifolium pratense]